MLVGAFHGAQIPRSDNNILGFNVRVLLSIRELPVVEDKVFNWVWSIPSEE